MIRCEDSAALRHLIGAAGTVMRLLIVICASGVLLEPIAVAGPPGELSSAIEAYFGAADSESRARRLLEITDLAGGELDVVVAALREIHVWPELGDAVGTIGIDPLRGSTPAWTYHLPDDYDCRLPHPLIVCLPSHDGIDGRLTISMALADLDHLADGFVLVAPHQALTDRRGLSTSAEDSLHGFSSAVRRRIHIDSERVFLYGIDRGADEAWHLELTHSWTFAGMIVHGGRPIVEYPRQVLPFLLENLRGLSIFSTWAAADPNSAEPRSRLTAAHNRAVIDWARQVGLSIDGIELRPGGNRRTGGAIDEDGAVADGRRAVLAARRDRLETVVARWFRRPHEGDVGWLRQLRFGGEVWDADQTSIAVAPGADRDTVIADRVKERMAYLGGRVEGNVIRIETRKCGRIEVRLRVAMIDFSKPLEVYCNGRRRYRRIVVPSIATLLETAQESWEFRHPVVARLSISIKSDAAGKVGSGG
ncbi:MAG: hypothetical protein IIB61_00085 [Planctomycetes bacterium]|nr:hypothetical protein [Planctomycetota bacterium]